VERYVVKPALKSYFFAGVFRKVFDVKFAFIRVREAPSIIAQRSVAE
jgi:hypothetical protein